MGAPTNEPRGLYFLSSTFRCTGPSSDTEGRTSRSSQQEYEGALSLRGAQSIFWYPSPLVRPCRLSLRIEFSDDRDEARWTIPVAGLTSVAMRSTLQRRAFPPRRRSTPPIASMRCAGTSVSEKQPRNLPEHGSEPKRRWASPSAPEPYHHSGPLPIQASGSNTRCRSSSLSLKSQ
jgi:hypothetical protein